MAAGSRRMSRLAIHAHVRTYEKNGGLMRYAAIGFCFILGCQAQTNTTAKRSTTVAVATVFTDSASYRARCKEADSLPKLTVIPQKCTPRDQRVEIR